ncbi:peptidase dimerization domain-containing protein [Streptomyces sp. NBC_00459]|uniref:peptidase dimerization domain-containing protein n=1 Tax=Streptomyces sp. NBC_00459 TaxID=2975749 RepID=UPI002E184DBA
MHALAELVTPIAELGSHDHGTTVNVGAISGGTGRNVIAGHARCGVDVRIADPAEEVRIDTEPAASRPPTPGYGCPSRGLEPSGDGADAALPTPLRAGAVGGGAARSGDP